MSTIARMIGWMMLTGVGGLIAINAIFMLVSPHRWFRLPDWLLAKGTLTEKRYGSGLGALEVRIAGAGVLGGMFWVLYDVFLRPK